MHPSRIVCLAAEIPEIFWRLGALDRVVGISAYTTRPAEALALPKVSGFQNGSAERIARAAPDLAILTSGVQRDLAAKLGEAGIAVLHLHPHRLSDMFAHIRLLGQIAGAAGRAESLCAELTAEVEAVRRAGAVLPRRPRVYFEEWMEPLICGAGWVSDLIEIAGGEDVFRERAVAGRAARERVVAPAEVAAADPELILASWCGRPFAADALMERPGARDTAAVRARDVHEVSGEILQCGPMLVDALQEVHARVRACAERLARAE